MGKILTAWAVDIVWQDSDPEFVKVYLNNYLAIQESESSIGKLDSELVVTA